MPQNFTADLTAVKFPSFLHSSADARPRKPLALAPAAGNGRVCRQLRYRQAHPAAGPRADRRLLRARPPHTCPRSPPRSPPAERLRRLPLNPVSPVGSTCERPILDRYGTCLRSAFGANPRIAGALPIRQPKEVQHGSRVQFLGRSGSAPRGGAVLRRRGNARLSGHWHVRDGDVAPLRRVQGHHRDRRAGHPRPHEHPRQLPRAVPAGRRHAAVRGHPHEPHAEQGCRLHRVGQLVEEGLQGGQALRRRPLHRQFRGRELHLRARRRRPHVQPRCRLRLHLPERDRLRQPLHQAARNRRHPAGLRCVEHVPLRAHGRVEVRPDLRRRAEERWPGRRGHRHRARRPDPRGCAALHAHHHALQDAGRRRQPVQHPAVLRHLHVRQGVPVAQGPGRP